ncbi:MAG: SLC13 family permease, partial [Gammaproteobacteria bacterium]
MSTTSKHRMMIRLTGAAIFVIIELMLSEVFPSREIAWVTAILLLTIYLFVFEIVAVDVAAVSIMVLLGLLSFIGPMTGMEYPFVPVQHLFDGFASNAVISIVAVMIIGAGLDKTGLMGRVAGIILKYGGTTEGRIIPLISATVALISSFMQNVGAAALFLPVVSRISARSGLPLSRLLMPMGFCAILGGTVTLVGSSPLILLNDLIMTSNQGLPEAQRMSTFHLFDVTPVGIALVITGIIYFVLAGRLVLPVIQSRLIEGGDTTDYLQRTYGITYDITEVEVSPQSPLVGWTMEEVEKKFYVRIVGMRSSDGLRLAPGGLARDVKIPARASLAVMAARDRLEALVHANQLSR